MNGTLCYENALLDFMREREARHNVYKPELTIPED